MLDASLMMYIAAFGKRNRLTTLIRSEIPPSGRPTTSQADENVTCARDLYC